MKAKKYSAPVHLVNALQNFGNLCIGIKNYDLAEELFLKAEYHLNEVTHSLESDENLLFWHGKGIANAFWSNLQLLYLMNGNVKKGLAVAERGRARSIKEHFNKHRSMTELTGEHLEHVNNINLDDEKMHELAARIKCTILYFADFSPTRIACWIIPPNMNEEIIFLHFNPLTESSAVRMNEYTKASNEVQCFENILQSRARTFHLAETSSHTSLTAMKQKDFHDLVYANIWNLLENHLLEYSNKPVIIVPDGEINKISFCSIFNSEHIPILKTYSISLTPSITILSKELDQSLCLPFSNPFKKAKILLVGNPEFGTASNLPWTEEECKFISKLFGEINSDINIKWIAGRAATKSEVMGNLPGSRFFHIASHASLDSRTGSIIPGSILLSSATPGEVGDDLLTSEDIESLDLRDMELAFLDCCFTGGGDVAKEGLVGLSRAFLYAGARHVIASKWEIPDSAETLHFVVRFYENYRDCGYKNIEGALRSAQLYMHSSGGSEEIWSSFFLMRGAVDLTC